MPYPAAVPGLLGAVIEHAAHAARAAMPRLRPPGRTRIVARRVQIRRPRLPTK